MAYSADKGEKLLELQTGLKSGIGSADHLSIGWQAIRGADGRDRHGDRQRRAAEHGYVDAAEAAGVYAGWHGYFAGASRSRAEISRVAEISPLAAQQLRYAVEVPIAGDQLEIVLQHQGRNPKIVVRNRSPGSFQLYKQARIMLRSFPRRKQDARPWVCRGKSAEEPRSGIAGSPPRNPAFISARTISGIQTSSHWPSRSANSRIALKQIGEPVGVQRNPYFHRSTSTCPNRFGAGPRSLHRMRDRESTGPPGPKNRPCGDARSWRE